MKPTMIRIPKNIPEMLDQLSLMIVSAPKFLDKTGWLPFLNLDYVFQQLNGGLDHNRAALGENRYQDLMRMSDQIRALFEADPEDKTGETRKGRDIIYEMEAIVKEAWRKPRQG